MSPPILRDGSVRVLVGPPKKRDIKIIKILRVSSLENHDFEQTKKHWFRQQTRKKEASKTRTISSRGEAKEEGNDEVDAEEQELESFLFGRITDGALNDDDTTSDFLNGINDDNDDDDDDDVVDGENDDSGGGLLSFEISTKPNGAGGLVDFHLDTKGSKNQVRDWRYRNVSSSGFASILTGGKFFLWAFLNPP